MQIALMLLKWIEALAKHKQVAVYCSDVAGQAPLTE
jgi:hypothetical protein